MLVAVVEVLIQVPVILAQAALVEAVREITMLLLHLAHLTQVVVAVALGLAHLVADQADQALS
jgi:hypothetical protein